MLHEKSVVMGRTVIQSSEHYLVVPWETWKESLPKLKLAKRKATTGKKKLLFIGVSPGGGENRGEIKRGSKGRRFQFTQRKLEASSDVGKATVDT